MGGKCCVRIRINTHMHTMIVRVAFVMLVLLVGIVPAPETMAERAHAGPDGDTTIAYVVTFNSDAGDPVRFQLRVPSSTDTVQLFFGQSARSPGRSEDLVEIEAYTESGHRLPIDRSAAGYTVHPDGAPFVANYSLRLQPTFLSPSAGPNKRLHSLRWDDYAYIGADALLQPRGFEMTPVKVYVSLPADWHLFVEHVGLTAGDDPIHFDNVGKASLLTGYPLIVRHVPSAVGRLAFVAAGTLPWTVETLAPSLGTLLEPLRALGLSAPASAHNFIIARYPGALRLNPLISGHIAGDRTLMHWVGIGTIDWWRKHAIRDFIALLVQQTLSLAADASWFSTGMGEYAGLLLLFKAGVLSMDEMYHSLHNMYVTGAHYSGPAWPSLASAATAEPQSHAAGRVLQFRSPMIAFLLDTELRTVSGGAMSLLDWWAALAAQQRMHPDTVLHSADLLPTEHRFGDWSAFADEHIFGTRVTPLDFDTAFNRWYSTMER